MTNPQSRNHFFVYPQVQKQDEIQALIAGMEAFRLSLGEIDRDLLGTIISYAEAHRSQAHLMPHLAPYEFMLLAILIEQQRELANHKENQSKPADEFTHPPFP